jgi:alpha-L-fucosidase
MYPYFESDRMAVKCCPSARQLAVEQMEFYAFAHFTVNTFTDKEWGDGTEPESIFNPTAFDAD